jgi:hypothetical protein
MQFIVNNYLVKRHYDEIENVSKTLDISVNCDSYAEKDFFSFICARVRDYSDGEVWSDGDQILCKTESAANALCDLLWQLYNERGEAFDLHASGYLMKPVTVPEVQRELADLRYPVQEEAPLLRVQAFGNFEVFFQGRPVHFRRSRTKELFAYLIDRRGAGSTMGELISILWEGRLDTPGVRSQLRSLITDLRTTLQALGQEAVIIKRRDLIAVDPKQVDCDYYRFLAGDRSPGNLFRGEYMSNYSWGETTLGALTGEDP